MQAKMKSMADEIKVPADASKTKKEIVYPEFSITSDQVEDIDEMKIGDEVMLMAKCSIKSLQEGKEWNDKTGYRASLCIKEAMVKPIEGKKPSKKSPKSIEDAEHEAMEEYK